MTDPSNWYQQSSLWDVPNDPVRGAATQTKETPYYLSVKWPGDDKAIFSLTSSYVPRGRQNLAAYMAVNADASSPDYGRMRVLQMSDTHPDRRARAGERDGDQRDRRRPIETVPQPGRGERAVRQPAHPAGGRWPAVRPAGLHPAAGQQRVLSRRCASWWSASASGRHRRHPAGRRWTRCSRATPGRNDRRSGDAGDRPRRPVRPTTPPPPRRSTRRRRPSPTPTRRWPQGPRHLPGEDEGGPGRGGEGTARSGALSLLAVPTWSGRRPPRGRGSRRHAAGRRAARRRRRRPGSARRGGPASGTPRWRLPG